jgi:type II secretory pathway pseudopilin PulG
MKPHCSKKSNVAMTLVEVLVVIAVLAVIVAILLPALAASKRKNSRLNCVSNLKQIGLAYRLWEGDNGDKYPMQISVTNGGAMELIAAGNVAACFQVMSNELSTPKFLVCPEDTGRIAATNFTTDFNNSHISYFINVDVTNETYPQTILSGDDNFEIGDVPVKSGLLELSSNTLVSWTLDRHTSYKSYFWSAVHGYGNIGLGDGSVQMLSQSGLLQAIQQTGVATNRLAIP